MQRSSIVVVVAVLAAAMLVDSLAVNRRRRDVIETDGYSADKRDVDDVIHFPTSVEELFADVYNNNSISLFLKSRESRYENRTIKEVNATHRWMLWISFFWFQKKNIRPCI